MKGLTAKQEKFCQLVASGKGQSEAYRGSYNVENMQDDTINNNAYKLMQNNDITTRIKQIQDEMAEAMKITVFSEVADLKKIEEIASQAIHGKYQNSYDLANWINAKKEIAKLLGLYAPTKVDQTNKNYTFTSDLDD
jgi:phage terminase small subunit